MKCNNCGCELTGTESFCPECGLQLRNIQAAGFSDKEILQELWKINKQLEEGNKQRAQLANAIGQLVANGALLNFLK